MTEPELLQMLSDAVAASVRLLLPGATGGGIVAWVIWRNRERFKASLQRDLTAEAEQLKHGLQREMLKAQLSTTQHHVVYPRLFERLRRAEGAVAGLTGLTFEASYEGYDHNDFERVLDDLKLPSGERARLAAALERNPRSGADELRATTRRVKLERARQRLFRTKNYIILKSLFLTDPVKKAALDAWGVLWHAWVDLETAFESKDGKLQLQANRELEVVGNRLQALEALMRAELNPERLPESKPTHPTSPDTQGRAEA